MPRHCGGLALLRIAPVFGAKKKKAAAFLYRKVKNDFFLEVGQIGFPILLAFLGLPPLIVEVEVDVGRKFVPRLVNDTPTHRFANQCKSARVRRPPSDFIFSAVVVKALLVGVHEIQTVRGFLYALTVAKAHSPKPECVWVKKMTLFIFFVIFYEGLQREDGVLERLLPTFFFASESLCFVFFVCHIKKNEFDVNIGHL
jgi:hypothetical protein